MWPITVTAGRTRTPSRTWSGSPRWRTPAAGEPRRGTYPTPVGSSGEKPPDPSPRTTNTRPKGRTSRPAFFANHAAAVAGGFKQTTLDRGATYSAATRYQVVLEKPIVGQVGASGGLLSAYGEGSSVANAEAVATSALNSQRSHRYGGSPGRATADANSVGAYGGALTSDVS